MENISKKIFTNTKTREECGLDYVLHNLDIRTPFGRNKLNNITPYYPGEEEELRIRLGYNQDIIEFLTLNPLLLNKLLEVFMEIKDSSNTVERSGKTTLSTVELFDIKQLLLQMRQILSITRDHIAGDYVGCHSDIDSVREENKAINENTEKKGNVPDFFILEDTKKLLDVLDPRGDRLNTFYIYEEFSQLLTSLRGEKREIEILIRKEQKQKREDIRKEYGVNLTPKFDIVVSKNHQDFEKISGISDLVVDNQDYMSVTFKLKPTPKVYEYTERIESINLSIDEEEERVREILSGKIAEYKTVLLSNCKKIGELDFAVAHGRYAIKNKLVMPKICDEHILEFIDGRNIQVESAMAVRGLRYCPVSLKLVDGVTVITGANMGGKTVSLKLAAQIPILAQYGLFVPAESAKVGLSNYARMLIGDSQSLERGLSSFGSEMEELKEILAQAEERSLIFIDEIASGTNPTEGTALTKSVVDYLSEKPFISMITTHFETGHSKSGVYNMQVLGLKNCDFDKLYNRIKTANRRERIKTISEYMDYRLEPVIDDSEVPKDALNIAAILGIDKSIIDGAKKYI